MAKKYLHVRPMTHIQVCPLRADHTWLLPIRWLHNNAGSFLQHVYVASIWPIHC